MLPEMRGNRPWHAGSLGQSERTTFDCSPDGRGTCAIGFVLIENGARWLDARDADSAAVHVVQSAAEPPAAFALRALREILAIEQSGRSLGRTVLYLAPCFDSEVTAARLLIVRGLITHFASVGVAGSSELLLRAGRPPPSDLQQGLPGLMATMLSESGSWAPPDRVSLDSGLAPS